MFHRVVLLIVIASLVGAAHGLKATPDKNYSPSQAMRALNLCKATNCQVPKITNWTCGPGCDGNPGMVDVTVAQNSTFESLGFTSYDKNLDTIIYAVRGSRNTPNWIADLDYKQIPYPNKACTGDCLVHRGFYYVHYDLALQMMPAFEKLLVKYPTAKVLVTGHSLGAAVTVLASTEIAFNHPNITSRMDVYTFGCPRVGNPAFVAWAAKQLPDGIQHRLTHDMDPVPHLPPKKLFGESFLHTPSEIFFKSNTSLGYKLCDDSATAEDPTCADSQLPLNPQDHIWYLGTCMGCCDPGGHDNCCKHLPKA